MHPTLQKSYKNRFSFRLGTTSFIYPDSYEANVRLLAPRFDEIELLMFESRDPRALPSKGDIIALRRLARDHGIRYNVHLPYDVAPGSRDSLVRRQSDEVLSRVIDLVAPLEPTSHTLHLAFEEKDRHPDTVAGWRERIDRSLKRIIARGSAGRSLSVENLDYPLQWLDDLIDENDLAVCLDIGHLLVAGADVIDAFIRYRNRIAIVHLHGVRGGCDHLPLDSLTGADMSTVASSLDGFSGSVSLEVFRFDHLCASLAVLEKIRHSWEDETPPMQGRA